MSRLLVSPVSSVNRMTVGTGAALVALLVMGTGIAYWRALSLRESATSFPTGTVATRRATDFRTAALLPEAKPSVASSVSAGSNDPLVSTLSAYRAGHWEEAEKGATAIIMASRTTPALRVSTPGKAASVLRARRVLAFSAARRKDLKTARERFAALAREAAHSTPSKTDAAQPVPLVPLDSAPGVFHLNSSQALREDALYQHAVCTLALGDKSGAEREWVTLIKLFPESPLVHASIKRIARLHGGDIPKEADAAWKSAMQTAQDREKERQRQASLCGPQVLAELIRRRGGKPASLEALARKMHTSERGTSLDALAKTARENGFTRADGFALTGEGLREKQVNLSKSDAIIALIRSAQSGHYVLVNEIAPDGAVTVWDGNGAGLNHPATRTYTRAEWRQAWQGRGKTGTALVLR